MFCTIVDGSGLAPMTTGVAETVLSSRESPLIASDTLFEARSIATPLIENLAFSAALIWVNASSGAASAGLPVSVSVGVIVNVFVEPEAP